MTGDHRVDEAEQRRGSIVLVEAGEVGVRNAVRTQPVLPSLDQRRFVCPCEVDGGAGACLDRPIHGVVEELGGLPRRDADADERVATPRTFRTPSRHHVDRPARPDTDRRSTGTAGPFAASNTVDVSTTTDRSVMQNEFERRRQFHAVVDLVYEPLQRYLARRIAPADVAEVLNDSLLVIWRRIEQVPVDDPLPWTYGVAKRCIANHRRASQRRLRLIGRITEHDARDELVVNAPTPDLADPELETALEALDESDRELIRLWAWEQLEPREIAVVLDATPNAVSLRLSRAKQRIRSSMERQDLTAAGHERYGRRREPGS